MNNVLTIVPILFFPVNEKKWCSFPKESLIKMFRFDVNFVFIHISAKKYFIMNVTESHSGEWNNRLQRSGKKITHKREEHKDWNWLHTNDLLYKKRFKNHTNQSRRSQKGDNNQMFTVHSPIVFDWSRLAIFVHQKGIKAKEISNTFENNGLLHNHTD